MKDKISFENSVREKSKKLIAQRKRQRKATLYTLSSLCVCFLLVFGLFLSDGFFPMKAFDAAAPESANGADFYYGDSQGKGNAHYDNTNGSINESSADTQTHIAIATSTAVPSVTQAPKETESPAVSSTAAAITPDSPAKTEQSVRTSTNSVTVYTSLIMTNTKSEDDISALIDAVFSYDEPKTERTDEFSVKVVFSTPIGKFTYFVTEDDVSGIVPTGDLSGDSGTNTQAPVTSAAQMPKNPSAPK